MRGEYVYGDEFYVDDYYMDEKWAYIQEFYPDYMISTHGRVWSTKNQIMLRIKELDNHGHLGVGLCRNGKQYYRYLHRLMADAFIPNPNNHPIVRHLNDQPDDNTLNNLAWGTQLDNYYDSVRNGTYKPFSDEDREKHLEECKTPIRATNLRTNERIIFESQASAARELRLEQSNIWKVLNGERRHTCGYYFEYIDKEEFKNGNY